MVDETNAALGIALLHVHGDEAGILRRIQNELFDLGADLSTPLDGRNAEGALRITQAQIDRLEKEIDDWNEDLSPLTSFVLPGGTAASSYLHLARTVCRRAEGLAVTASRDYAINPLALMYLNRLSDHLFVLGRRLNDGGDVDILWQPGASRN